MSCTQPLRLTDTDPKFYSSAFTRVYCHYMYEYIPLLGLILASGSLVLTIISSAILIDYVMYKSAYLGQKLTTLLWPLIIATSIGGVALALLYSEYFLYVPCSLCWLQRIALFPQALLVILAWRMNDTKYFPSYGIGLSIFGLLVAIYQYIYQMLPVEVRESGITPCLIDGSNADCANKVIDHFGFVTFPFISAITFVFLIALYLTLKRVSQK